MPNRYNLRALPAYELIQPNGATWVRPDGTEVPASLAESVLKWSGKSAAPAIGDRVKIIINSLGAGSVVGYFIEHGFLGVEVKLSKPPAWHVKQNGRGAAALVFGNELHDPALCPHCQVRARTVTGEYRAPTCGASECQQADYEASDARGKRRADAKRNRPRSRRVEREGGR